MIPFNKAADESLGEILVGGGEVSTLNAMGLDILHFSEFINILLLLVFVYVRVGFGYLLGTDLNVGVSNRFLSELRAKGGHQLRVVASQTGVA